MTVRTRPRLRRRDEGIALFVVMILIVVLGVVVGVGLGFLFFALVADGIDLSGFAAGIELAGMRSVLVPVLLLDDVVLVVHWRKTTDRVVKAAVRQLPIRTIKAIGIVLNRVDMKKQVRFGGHDAASFYEKYQGYYT